MHIILGALGAIITILVLVNRLKETGIDLGWLNPFTWAHRRRWRKKYHADPAFSIQSPMQAAAGLMYVAAKCSGDISKEEKEFLIETFKSDFNLSNSEASDLLSSCAFIIKDEDSVVAKLDKYIEPSFERFSSEQLESTISLVDTTVSLSSCVNEKQQKLLTQLKNIAQGQPNKENW